MYPPGFAVYIALGHVMLVNQSDPKNTRALIGEYLAYHNLLRYLCEDRFGSLKNAPDQFQEGLLAFKRARDRLAHDLWEIIHSDIIALNEGEPTWRITHAGIEEMIKDLLNVKNEILRFPSSNQQVK